MPPSLLSGPNHRLCCVQHVYIFSKKASKNHKRCNQKLVGSPCIPPILSLSLQKHLKTHTGHMRLLFLLPLKKTNQGLFPKKITDIADYLLIIVVAFNVKCKTGGCWLLLEEPKASCFQIFVRN